MTMALTLSPTERGSLSGIVLAAVAFALATSADIIFKLIAAKGYPVYQILLVNGCFALIPIVAAAIMTGGPVRLYTMRPFPQLARGAISALSGFAAIYAYSRLPLTDFYAIVFAGPLIVTALSAFWLGEKIGLERWFAIIAGFAGILIVAAPIGAHSIAAAGSEAVIGRCAALVSVFCYALSVVLIRRMRLGETNLSFCFYGSVANIFISGILFLLCGGPTLHMNEIMSLMLSGMLAGTSSISLITAYHRTPVALVAPFQYTQIIWGAVAGYVLWAQVPSARLITGAIIVASSGLFVIYREFKTKENR
jgi:drug/metabolite transporter (DMT)-like permease